MNAIEILNDVRKEINEIKKRIVVGELLSADCIIVIDACCDHANHNFNALETEINDLIKQAESQEPNEDIIDNYCQKILDEIKLPNITTTKQMELVKTLDSYGFFLSNHDSDLAKYFYDRWFEQTLDNLPFKTVKRILNSPDYSVSVYSYLET